MKETPPDYQAMLGEINSQQAELLKLHAEFQAFAQALNQRDQALRSAMAASAREQQEQLATLLTAQRQQFEMFIESYRQWQQEDVEETAPGREPPRPQFPPPLPLPVEENLPEESKAMIGEAEANLLQAGIAVAAAAGCIGYTAACPWIALGAEILSGIISGLSYEGAAEILATVSSSEIVEQLPDILNEYPETAPYIYALMQNSPYMKQVDTGTRERLRQLAQEHVTAGVEDIEYLRNRYSQPISNFDCESVQIDLSRYPDDTRNLAYWLNDLYGQEVLGDGVTLEECVKEWIR